MTTRAAKSYKEALAEIADEAFAKRMVRKLRQQKLLNGR